jgi:hypothetical protein
MDALVEFLQDHHVDVSELVERQTTILNSGIYISGQAQVSTESMAAGRGARAVAGQAASRLGRGGSGGAGNTSRGGRS